MNTFKILTFDVRLLNPIKSIMFWCVHAFEAQTQLTYN